MLIDCEILHDDQDVYWKGFHVSLHQLNDTSNLVNQWWKNFGRSPPLWKKTSIPPMGRKIGNGPLYFLHFTHNSARSVCAFSMGNGFWKPLAKLTSLGNVMESNRYSVLRCFVKATESYVQIADSPKTQVLEWSQFLPNLIYIRLASLYTVKDKFSNIRENSGFLPKCKISKIR